MIDLRLPTGSPTTSITRLPRSPPLPPLSPLRPSVRHRIHREVAWPAGRSVAVAPPVPVGRNVDAAAAAAHSLCPLRCQPVGALIHSVAGMHSDVLEPHCRAIGP